MQLFNDATAIRFYGIDDDAFPNVTPKSFAEFCTQIEIFAVFVARRYELSASCEVSFCASPEQGSLIIWIRHAIEVTVDKTIDNKVVKERAHTLANFGAIGLVIWTVCFGQSGVYDLLSRNADRDNKVSLNEYDNLGERSLSSLLSDEILNQAFLVYYSAKKIGASRVTIQCPGSDVVTVYDRMWERDARRIGCYGRKSIKAASVTAVADLVDKKAYSVRLLYIQGAANAESRLVRLQSDIADRNPTLNRRESVHVVIWRGKAPKFTEREPDTFWDASGVLTTSLEMDKVPDEYLTADGVYISRDAFSGFEP